ncbi:MAG: ABC transporter permease subunit [Phycisphaerae bacterium]|nr:ABC transporter permease subunit [Phycisphaerae bacterium]
MWTIASREYAAFFRLPVGWLVTALFVCLSAVIFTRSCLAPGQPATMREFFGLWWSILIIVAPSISMRLFSEELRTGTIETLLTSPVNEAALVVGKFLAAWMFLATILAPTICFVGVLWMLAAPDPGPILSGYIGVMLLGMLYLAAGTLVSSLTSSQTLAFLGAMFLLIGAEVAAQRLSGLLSEPWSGLVDGFSVQPRMADFARGVIDSAHVVFFVCAAVWCLGIATVLLQSRRWR